MGRFLNVGSALKLSQKFHPVCLTKQYTLYTVRKHMFCVMCLKSGHGWGKRIFLYIAFNRLRSVNGIWVNIKFFCIKFKNSKILKHESRNTTYALKSYCQRVRLKLRTIMCVLFRETVDSRENFVHNKLFFLIF